jgi:hypothetical protein
VESAARWAIPLAGLVWFSPPANFAANTSHHWMTFERSIRWLSWFATRQRQPRDPSQHAAKTLPRELPFGQQQSIIGSVSRYASPCIRTPARGGGSFKSSYLLSRQFDGEAGDQIQPCWEREGRERYFPAMLSAIPAATGTLKSTC